MNEFIQDNSWQIKIRNRILEPYYESISHNKRFIFVDKGKLAEKLQREMAIDTIIQLKNNGVLGIEEKIVRWPGYKYQNYTLEIMSCTMPGHEKKGWMYYATCDCAGCNVHRRPGRPEDGERLCRMVRRGRAGRSGRI